MTFLEAMKHSPAQLIALTRAHERQRAATLLGVRGVLAEVVGSIFGEAKAEFAEQLKDVLKQG